MSRRPRILLIRLSAIGDVIVTTPVTRALRAAYPEAYIAWVVEPRAADIVAGNPHLDAVLVWNRPKGGLSPAALWQARSLLRPHGFDWAIDFQGLFRSALLARLSGARRIVGNREAREGADLLYTEHVPKRRDDPSNRQRCLDLLRPLGVESEDRRMLIPVGDEHRREAAALLSELGLPAGARVACLVPATTWPQKHWFEESWAALADRLHARLGLFPLLMGAPGDRPMAERIAAAAARPCAIAAGRTSLKVAAALLERAALTVAVDTALMHASVAMGTPTLGLCGASFWPAFADYAPFRLLREPLPCSPCLRHPVCGGRFDCMRALEPERVFAAAAELLEAGGTGSPAAREPALRIAGPPA